ncbi:MAG: hypothetical protein AB7T38_05195 [Nitrospirales bacterium]
MANPLATKLADGLSGFKILQGCFLMLILSTLVLLVWPNDGIADMGVEVHHPEHEHAHSYTVAQGQWEGSLEGIAYSEFNHAFAGLGVILVGLSELQTAMGWHVVVWVRWFLPVSLIVSGIFVLIWSDHEAWPIGSWTLAETLSGKDPEMLQHKIFGILALGVGLVEWFFRVGKIHHFIWRALLPGFALIGGFMLFMHMHGPHPAGHQIQVHHNMMGTLALAGGVAWFVGEWLSQSQASINTSFRPKSFLKIIWALFVIMIGVQLVLYSEI